MPPSDRVTPSEPRHTLSLNVHPVLLEVELAVCRALSRVVLVNAKLSSDELEIAANELAEARMLLECATGDVADLLRDDKEAADAAE